MSKYVIVILLVTISTVSILEIMFCTVLNNGTKYVGEEVLLPKPSPKFNTSIPLIIRGNKHAEKQDQGFPQPIKLAWTSIYGKRENDSYHFFSAYFDDRIGAPNRPAVIVMGYAYDKVKDIPLYCVFKYADGHSLCLSKPLMKKHPSPCLHPKWGAKIYHYYCSVKTGEEPPVLVMISNVSTCNPNFTSNEVTVENRERDKGKMLKKFGVCVGGPVIENKNIIQDLVEFISMSKLMGAELITLYISREQLNDSIFHYILHRYSNIIRMVEWKKYEKFYPMHYYGQLLIISDCVYRSMYEVEYLVQMDIDEMIIPMKQRTWSEFVHHVPVVEKYATFMFLNAFFTSETRHTTENLLNCGNFTVAKYITKTDRITCFPGDYYYKAKLMIRPKLMLETSIHYPCSVINGYRKVYQVPEQTAILGHYRIPIPDVCVTKSTRVDKSVLKYSDALKREICSTL